MKLVINNLQKSFSQKQVLKDISFSCESGQSIALLGRNGAGKTTLFRCLLGIFSHDDGDILIDGKPIDRTKIRFGYLPEERGLYMDRTVFEQMMYFGRLKGLTKEQAEKSIDDLLERLDATQYKFSQLETLSKGNKQKIQLAISVIDSPDIVIFDEPFSGLDPVSSKLLKKLIEDFANDGKIVIFSSHEMSYTEEFCETISILNNGKIELFGNLKDIKDSYPRTNLKILINKTSDFDIQNDLSITSLCESITKKGDYYFLQLKDENDTKKIQHTLLQEGVLIDEFIVSKPSLEEIFVEKVGA